MTSPERAKLKKIRRLAFNDNTLLDAVTMLITEYRQQPQESAARDFLAVLMLEKFRNLLQQRTDNRFIQLRNKND